jgi:hypothetical protein
LKRPLVLGLAIALAAGGGALGAALRAFAPQDASGAERVFEVAPGDTRPAIARRRSPSPRLDDALDGGVLESAEASGMRERSVAFGASS